MMVFNSFFNRKREKIHVRGEKKISNSPNSNNFSIKISKDLAQNIENLHNMLDRPDDLKIRELKLGVANKKCVIAYISGIVEVQSVQQDVIGNIEAVKDEDFPDEAEKVLNFIYWKVIAVSEVTKGKTLDDISFALLSGQTIVYLEGMDTVLMIDTVGGEYRAIQEPITETLIRGPREGFVENIQTNLALVRRNLKDPNLRFKTYQAGRRSKKNIVVAYVDGITNPNIVTEVNRRLKTMDIDIISESGYVEEWIEDSFLSPFPQILTTERPDKVVSAVTQGQIAIFVDGSPFVLLAPVSFANVLQSPEDYYDRWTIGTLLRVLRYFGAFLSIFLPSLYIALISIQPGMLPSELVFSIAATREGVPFSAIAEALLMVITMELLQEAGARLPQTIGQTIGIVGGLVIGEAAVQAGIVSPIMVVVIALTAIATFAIPAYSVAISFRIIRFGFMFAAAIFGLFGIILAYIIVNIHIVNLKSFGVPYSTPFAPFFLKDWNDVVIRAPLQTFNTRPDNLETKDNQAINAGGEKE